MGGFGAIVGGRRREAAPAPLYVGVKILALHAGRSAELVDGQLALLDEPSRGTLGNAKLLGHLADRKESFALRAGWKLFSHGILVTGCCTSSTPYEAKPE